MWAFRNKVSFAEPKILSGSMLMYIAINVWRGIFKILKIMWEHGHCQSIHNSHWDDQEASNFLPEGFCKSNYFKKKHLAWRGKVTQIAVLSPCFTLNTFDITATRELAPAALRKLKTLANISRHFVNSLENAVAQFVPNSRSQARRCL